MVPTNLKLHALWNREFRVSFLRLVLIPTALASGRPGANHHELLSSTQCLDLGLLDGGLGVGVLTSRRGG